jgi:hypothetical protein
MVKEFEKNDLAKEICELLDTQFVFNDAGFWLPPYIDGSRSNRRPSEKTIKEIIDKKDLHRKSKTPLPTEGDLLITLDGIHKILISENQRAPIYKDEEDFVKKHIEEYKLQVDPSTGILQYYPLNTGIKKDTTPKDFEIILKRALVQYNSTLPVRSFKSESIVAVYQGVNIEEEAGSYAKIVNELKYNPSKAALVDDWIKAWLKIMYIDANDCNITAFKHFFWNIKRKLNLESAGYPMFFVLYSTEQGVGKTEAFKRLFPYPRYYKAANISKLLDSADRLALTRDAYLVDMEELGLGRKAEANVLSEDDVNNIKQAITAVHIDTREYHTQKSIKTPNKVTLVSSTNISLSSIYTDSSGSDNRRFWEWKMNIPKNHKEIDPQFWLKLDPLHAQVKEIYAGIDETSPVGFYHPDNKPIYLKMCDVQKQMISETPVVQFMKARGYLYRGLSLDDISDANPDIVKVTVKAFQADFTKWWEQNRVGERFNLNYLRKLMFQAGLETQTDEENRSWIVYKKTKQKEKKNDLSGL